MSVLCGVPSLYCVQSSYGMYDNVKIFSNQSVLLASPHTLALSRCLAVQTCQVHHNPSCIAFIAHQYWLHCNTVLSLKCKL
jgi:hypothetical protein